MSRLLPDPDVAGAWMVRVGDADQSWIDPDDPTRLEFDYMQRIADHLDVHRPAGERMRVIHLGGAGMLTRYAISMIPRTPSPTRSSFTVSVAPDLRRTIPRPLSSSGTSQSTTPTCLVWSTSWSIPLSVVARRTLRSRGGWPIIRTGCTIGWPEGWGLDEPTSARPGRGGSVDGARR